MKNAENTNQWYSLKTILAIGAVLALAGAIYLAGTASAHEAPARTQVKTDVQNGTKPPADGTRLQDARLRACLRRETAINRTITRVVDRSQKQLDLFSRIDERVREFYGLKGYSLDNFTELANDAQSKQAVARDAVNSLAEYDSNFSCASEDPLNTLQQFRLDHRSVVDALTSYRLTLIDLITGIRSAAVASEGNG